MRTWEWQCTTSSSWCTAHAILKGPQSSAIPSQSWKSALNIWRNWSKWVPTFTNRVHNWTSWRPQIVNQRPQPSFPSMEPNQRDLSSILAGFWSTFLRAGWRNMSKNELLLQIECLEGELSMRNPVTAESKHWSGALPILIPDKKMWSIGQPQDLQNTPDPSPGPQTSLLWIPV